MLIPSPFLISVMSTVASLPFFLLTLPAGALAELVDLRDQSLVGGCGRRLGDTWLAASSQSLQRSSYPVKGGAHA